MDPEQDVNEAPKFLKPVMLKRRDKEQEKQIELLQKRERLQALEEPKS